MAATAGCGGEADHGRAEFATVIIDPPSGRCNDPALVFEMMR